MQQNRIGDFSLEHLDGSVDDSTRGRLIRATIELFIEGGYEAARVQRIARRAGLTTGAIYANFASKEALLSEAIGEASMAGLRASLTEVGRGLSAAEILGLLGAEALGAPPHPNHAMIMQGLARATTDPHLHRTVVEPVQALNATIRELLEQAQREGAIAPEVDLDAFAWLALTIGLGSFVLKSLDLGIPDPAGIADLTQRLMAGFAPPGP